MTEEKKTPMTLISLTAEERALLKQLAARDGTTLTGLVRRALEVYAKIGEAGNQEH